MGGKWKRNNRGMSLVEVLVVVAIMAVVGMIVGMGINAMSGKPAQKCAQQIIYSLEKHRTSTMGKVSAKYVLRRDANGDVVAEEYLSNEETLGSSATNVYKMADKRTKVSYVCGSSSSSTTKDLDTAALTLQFDRTNGAFKKQPDDTYCTEIIIQRGGRTYNVALIPLTGKVYLD